MNKRKWNTYFIQGFSDAVGTERRAQGGVQLLQVKWSGKVWLRRIVDANGPYESAGEVVPLSLADGEALYERAKYFAEGPKP